MALGRTRFGGYTHLMIIRLKKNTVARCAVIGALAVNSLYADVDAAMVAHPFPSDQSFGDNFERAVSEAMALTLPATKSSPLPALSTPAIFDTTGAARTWSEAIADLATASVIAVGEVHTSAADHRVQAEVLTALASRTPRLAVAFEMVSFEDQAVLDNFMSGAMPEKDFAAWWKANWRLDFALYKPIFDAAKAAGVPAYGLNAPSGLVEAVSKHGLASLSPTERARLPAQVMQSADPRYRAFVLEGLSGHGGPLTPEQLENRIEAMAVWNETMGEKAAGIVATGRTVLVITGHGHIFYKAGVLESAARRGAGLGKALLPWSGAPQPDELELADWFRVAP